MTKRWIAAGLLILLAGGIAWYFWAGPAELPLGPATPAEPVAEGPLAVTLVPSPTPVPLVLVARGCGQSGSEVACGFVIENPSEQLVTAMPFRLTLYDESGETILRLIEGEVDRILPGQRVGHVEETRLSNEDQRVGPIELVLGAGQRLRRPSDASAFTAERLHYIADEGYPRATGLIVNPTDRDLSELRVSALAFDDGEVVGGGYSYVDYVPAEGRAPAEVLLTLSRPADRVELYAVRSSLSVLLQRQMPAEQGLCIADLGHGQDGGTVAYAFDLGCERALESTFYQAAAYDAEGHVLATDSGYIEQLLPGQGRVVAGTMYVVNETPVERVEVQVRPGDPLEGEGVPLQAERPAFYAGRTFSQVTGVIRNPHDVDLASIRVDAVAYDAQERIIGGGFTFVDWLPAQSQLGVRFGLTVSEPPGRVALYPAISSSTEPLPPDERPRALASLAVTQVGLGIEYSRAGYGFMLENGAREAAGDVGYYVTLYDEAGHVRGTAEGVVERIAAGDTMGVAGTLPVLGEVTAARDYRVVVQLLTAASVGGQEAPAVAVGDVAFEAGELRSRVTGLLRSAHDTDLTDVDLYALAYDADGAIIGAGDATVERLPAGERLAVEVPVLVTGDVARVALWADVGGG